MQKRPTLFQLSDDILLPQEIFQVPEERKSTCVTLEKSEEVPSTLDSCPAVMRWRRRKKEGKGPFLLFPSPPPHFPMGETNQPAMHGQGVEWPFCLFPHIFPPEVHCSSKHSLSGGRCHIPTYSTYARCTYVVKSYSPPSSPHRWPPIGPLR